MLKRQVRPNFLHPLSPKGSLLEGRDFHGRVSCCKLSPMKIPSSRLVAPGSPRMNFLENERIVYQLPLINEVNGWLLCIIFFSYNLL